jgi:hypothetical protein
MKLQPKNMCNVSLPNREAFQFIFIISKKYVSLKCYLTRYIITLIKSGVQIFNDISSKKIFL